MRTTRRHSTNAELAVRRALWGAGARGYRVNARPLSGLPRTADIVFRARKLAVFIDGCFWHACPEHGTKPKANERWWRDKLRDNRIRDADTNEKLTSAGWSVLRVWEHTAAEEAAAEILDELRLITS